MREKYVHQLFVVSVGLKGFYALLEIAAGIALQMVSTEAIVSYLRRLGHHGHLADPHDWIGNGAMALARSFSVETQHFYAFYLVTHGVLKLAIVVGLLREKLWSYPAANEKPTSARMRRRKPVKRDGAEIGAWTGRVKPTKRLAHAAPDPRRRDSRRL